MSLQCYTAMIHYCYTVISVVNEYCGILSGSIILMGELPLPRVPCMSMQVRPANFEFLQIVAHQTETNVELLHQI